MTAFHANMVPAIAIIDNIPTYSSHRVLNFENGRITRKIEFITFRVYRALYIWDNVAEGSISIYTVSNDQQLENNVRNYC
jgi:hypothetical protein